MTRKTKKKTSASDSALAKIGSLPQVGNGWSGYDIALGFSHKYALEIALDTLSELKKGEVKQIFVEIYDVFEKWKYEHGIYPPKSNLRSALFGLGGDNSQEPEPAKEYIKRQMLAAKLAGEKQPKHIEAWECDSFAKTPVRLLYKLIAEDYPPLNASADRIKVWRYDYILAAAIIMTHKEDAEYQSDDCIEGALKLAELRLSTQKELIKKILPLAEETFNRKRQLKIKRKAAHEENERNIIELHQEYLKEGNIPPYKVYAEKLGCSEATISRTLKKHGFRKYKGNKIA